MKKAMSRGQSAIQWIEKFCVHRGEPVRLTHAEQHALRLLYDNPDNVQAEPLTDRIGAFVSLHHVCGPPAKTREPGPATRVDPFTAWSAAGPLLRKHLKREGSVIRCPELGTSFSAAA